jgi:hypothetical protein
MKFATWLSLPILTLCAVPGAFAADPPPSFSKDVQPFLNRYCVECHKGNRGKAGVNLESYQTLMKGDRRGRSLVIAGKPDNSRLMHTMEGKAKQMPPKKSMQPDPKEVASLRAWIVAGAKDDSKAGGKPAAEKTGLLDTDRTNGLVAATGAPYSVLGTRYSEPGPSEHARGARFPLDAVQSKPWFLTFLEE